MKFYSFSSVNMATITQTYIRPWARIQTFLVGIWLGWILYKTRGKTLKLPAWSVAIGWLLSTGLVLTVMFAIQPWMNPENTIPEVAGFFYSSFHRFCFGLSISWVIFACIKGYGGLVNSFLSWSVFMPLGRLCFCVYLVSLHVQMALQMGVKVPIKFESYVMTNLFFAHMVMSYIMGFFATMLFESPFIILQKLAFEGK